eukprot:11089311-Alexandrium_andersonii.AAC.1
MPRYGQRATTPPGRKGDRTMAARQASSQKEGTRAVLTGQVHPSKGDVEMSCAGPSAMSRRRRAATGPGMPRTSTLPSCPPIETGRAARRCRTLRFEARTTAPRHE